jgi:tRNA-dihydrouridine synthase 4
MTKPKVGIVEMLKETSRWKAISAPMVRYSKLPFRQVVREYGVDIAYTPMIMADSFAQSAVARHNEFQAHSEDYPLVAQFAANRPDYLAKSIEYIAPHVDGIDLNCGCPQKWALQEGIGASLIDPVDDRWDKLEGLVKTGVEACQRHSLPFAVKMRVLPSTEKTLELARHLESLGIAWLTVHGRTKKEGPSDPVDTEKIWLIKKALQIPVIANGDVFCLEDAKELARKTGANGVMAARGLLENPALFAGNPQTPWEAVDLYIGMAVASGTPTAIFHHHISQMTGKLLGKAAHKTLNALANTSIPTIIDFIHSHKPVL